jgi:hypothetical protein
MPMTTEKLREAFLSCETIISKEAQREGITMAIRDPDADTPTRRFSHMLWMSREGLKLIEDDRREKAQRWLGFLQGALWSLKLAGVAELKDMNRPDDSEHDAKRI